MSAMSVTSEGVAPAGRARASEVPAAGPTVHEFLSRIVIDHRVSSSAEGPAAVLEETGSGRFASAQVQGQVQQACAHALDFAPADVVEISGPLRTGPVHGPRPADAALVHPTAATHTTEIAFMDSTPNLPTFGLDGDVDGALNAQGGQLNVENTAHGAVNTVGGTVDSVAAHGPLSNVVDQVHDTASHLPVAGPVVNNVLPDHLPTVAQAPSAVTHTATHLPQELHDVTSSLPVAGPAVGHVTTTVGHVADPVHDVAGHLPVAGPVVDQATSNLGGLNGSEHAGLGAPIEGVADHLPVVGDIAGQLPLHG